MRREVVYFLMRRQTMRIANRTYRAYISYLYLYDIHTRIDLLKRRPELHKQFDVNGNGID